MKRIVNYITTHEKETSKKSDIRGTRNKGTEEIDNLKYLLLFNITYDVVHKT